MVALIFIVLLGILYPSKFITKTCLCNVDPLKPHFYIVKLGFTVVHIIFPISPQKEVLTCTHNLCFEQKYIKINIRIFV